MNTFNNIPGFYGKIPLKGDFVSQRLPAAFVGPWDHWLQASLRDSQEALGDAWLELYLTSPIWRFVLGRQICDDNAWAGILMPSVDRVGRYFPLTLAARIHAPQAVAAMCSKASCWFDQLEQIALTALEDGFDFTAFDDKLQNLAMPDPIEDPPITTREKRSNGTPGGLRIEQHGETISSFELSARLLMEFMPTCSLWNTTGSEACVPVLMIFEDLPAAQDYVGFLSDPALPAPTIPPPKKSHQVEEIPLEIPALGDPQVPNEPATLRWQSCAETTVGKRRQLNEDALLNRQDLGLWVVADGMGGHSAGDVASQTVVDHLGELSPAASLDALARSSQVCLGEVNRELLSMASKLGPEHIIGTTVVALLAIGRHCAAIWAGDSRLYRLRNGKLCQLTEDHSMAAEMSKTPHSIPDGLGDNIVTRALGASADLKLDRLDFEAEPGDRYLLCSDGLIKEMHPAEIENILTANTCEAVVRELIELALQRQARDNVTVIVIDAEPA